MFVRLMSLEMYPASKVERIWKKEGSNNTIDGFAYIEGVGECSLYYGEYERLWQGERVFVAANSGYKMLERFDDGDSKEIIENDIVAWSIDHAGHVSPVTLEGTDQIILHPDGILRPDGKIVDATGANEVTRDEILR